MLDDMTFVRDLKTRVLEFTESRKWLSAHDPKNLAMSIAIEAAELMEHFQWGERAQYALPLVSDESYEAIRLEVADVMIYLLSFCRALEIDLSKAVLDKIAINENRWPLEHA